MSDLEIDFEELQELFNKDSVKDSFHKLEQIQFDYKFETLGEVATMFDQWAADRAAGLHD
jgi:hypothetical protein